MPPRRFWFMAGRCRSAWSFAFLPLAKLPLAKLPLGLLLLALLSVGGCTVLREAALPGMLPADWPARRTALQEWSRFDLRGRVAVASGADGFTAALRWAQRAGVARLELDGPLGVGGLRLELADGRYADEAARTELERRLGFALPVASLRYWLLGVPDPARTAEETVAADARVLAGLLQDGWSIRYAAYAAVPGAGYELPQRIEVTRGDVRVRLLVEGWGAGRR